MRDWHLSSVGRCRTEYEAPLLFAARQFAHLMFDIIVSEVQSLLIMS